ncbi:MAG: alcohol dehydrogenase catalytic domain-containing protein [Pseudomonadota bacterium]
MTDRPEASPHEAGTPAPANAAIVCLGKDRTRLEDQAIPVPGPGEIVLKMRRSGLCGTDLFKLTTDTATPGTVLGHEITGDVVDVGTGVTGFSVGDRVVVPHHVACGQCVLCRNGNETMCVVFKENLMQPGGFANFILIKARAVSEAARGIPDEVSDEAAVFMEPAACVLRGIDRSGLSKGGAAIVFGCGSMGLLHVITLRAIDPSVRILAIDLDSERLRLAGKLGAAFTSRPGPDAGQAAETMTNGFGVDAVFDTVGGSALLDSGLSLARAGGTIVLFAHAGDGETADMDLNAFFKKEQRVVATYSGGLDEQRRVFDMICRGTLDPSPLVTHLMPLSDFTEGVTLTRERRALKVLYTPMSQETEGAR